MPETAIATRGNLIDVQALIAQAIDRGVDVATMERLVALAKDMRGVQAKEAWNEAIAAFQATCPPIKKTASASIRTRAGGQYGYKYAPLDDILSVVQPVLSLHGLSVSWRQHYEDTRVMANCRISHTMGHFEESGDLAIPIEQAAEGGSGASPAQRVGIASTYARRYSLLAILGKAPEDDEDAQTQHETPPQQEPDTTLCTEPQQKLIRSLTAGAHWSETDTKEYLTKHFAVGSVVELSKARASDLINFLKAETAKK